MKRGQISIEFVTIFGFIFLMTIPLIIIFFDQSGSVQDSISENHVRNIAVKIVDKAETIYYLGEPSKTTVKAYFPDRIESFEIDSREIRFFYRRAKGILSEIYVVSAVNISGNISTDPGIHYINLESSPTGVIISE